MVGGYPIQVWMVGGVPHLRSEGGTPHHPDLDEVPPWDGVPPTPHLGWGTPHHPDLDWVPASQVWMVGGTKGTPSTIQTLLGYPPGMGTPHPRPEMWYPPHHPELDGVSPQPTRQSSYAAGGMPLAFTQEDFLVAEIALHFLKNNTISI